jgi:excisionase family DNA binding protein
MKSKNEITPQEKVLLTMNEAAAYFGIGQKTLIRFLEEHQADGLTVQNGKWVLVKRQKLENFINDKVTVL